MQEAVRWIPIYTTRRTIAAFLGYPYLFDTKGRWIGVVTPEGRVYATNGTYVGYLDPEPKFARILRHVATAPLYPPIQPPKPPPFSPNPGWTVPLPPPPPKLPPQTIDVLAAQPELLPPHASQEILR